MKRLHPSEVRRVGARRDKVLWLRGGDEDLRVRDDTFHMPAVVLFMRPNEPGSAWMSRLVGGDRERVDFAREPAGAYYFSVSEQGERLVIYPDIRPGTYEAQSYMDVAGQAHMELTRVYFRYTKAHGFVLWSYEEVLAAVRDEVTIDFGEVRSLVAAGAYDAAERAAHWLHHKGEREAAIRYVATARHRDQSA